MIKFLIGKIFGTRNERYLRSLRSKLKKCNALEPQMKALSDEEIPAKLAEYRDQVQNGGRSLDDVLPEVFALVREASSRVMGMRHYDVQLVGGMVLHAGKIAEMKTGEGKTLVATLPVVLNALSGKGVHVVTVNDYLARRDAEWMGRLYNFLGLSVGVIVQGLTDDERKAAYACDITYGTNNEFGFDYLRDNMKFYAEQLVQRGHNFAIVDEVDSILIDEARTPLIISGASDESTELYQAMDAVVRQLKAEEDYTLDEKAKTAMLTDAGVAKCEKILGIDNLFDPASISYQHHILQSLKAHHCFKRDVDYIVSDEGKVVIVDEFTGRLMPGRRFSDGLHQALEAKEGVKVEAENQTLASITFQNYFRMYDKLAGMTGTAQTEAVEFDQIYHLETITIPTNKPMIRKDLPDLIFRTQREKYHAIIESIKELYKTGQPVLVGTISIETSELLSSMLKKEGVPHSVLNAKHHAEEAAIVAQAGQKGHVTIATNMAGRGTDIVLGEGVKELGGLHILGTERHESRRIDNQLRGRSGRQGDPGSSRFYLSLEDNLMRLFGSERISGLMEKLGMKEGEPIENRMVSKAIENAQKRVEGHNFEIRKTLLDYDNVMNQQREVIYTLRRDLMQLPDVEGVLFDFVDEVLDNIYQPVEAIKEAPDAQMCAEVNSRLMETLNIARAMPEMTMSAIPSREQSLEAVKKIFQELREEAGPVYNDILRYFLLESLDRCWKDHLRAMDYLREGIGLRGYAQRDPKREYQSEGLAMFKEMLFRIHEGALTSLTHVRMKRVEAEPAENAEGDAAQPEGEGDAVQPVEEAGVPAAEEKPAEEASAEPEKAPEPEEPAGQPKAEPPLNLRHKTDPAAMGDGGASAVKEEHHLYNGVKVGRNDPCPCGSGKKFKKCCGRNL
ncbi:preprotein translocase subunit SecA [uncultured Mailhella sp.]|uniref:preprotein translocase subunit SecA n=1 Tax=uncultured Mailhella sp. TaxID=1981031 RepID=UPI0025F9DD8C|nr:preprotein translocase subunit SecA [uncultured Mailhella sp.]